MARSTPSSKQTHASGMTAAGQRKNLEHNTDGYGLQMRPPREVIRDRQAAEVSGQKKRTPLLLQMWGKEHESLVPLDSFPLDPFRPGAELASTPTSTRPSAPLAFDVSELTPSLTML